MKMARVFARQFQGLSGLGLGGVKFIRGVVGMGLGGSIGTRGMCRSRKYYRIGIQGAPMKAGQKQNGVEHGPGIITGTGLVTTLEEDGHNVYDYGLIPLMQPREKDPWKSQDDGANMNSENGLVIKNETFVGDACKIISKHTESVLHDNRICVTLGGDHSLSIGTIHGVAEVYKDIGVLWVDAHADINTPLTSKSGNIHGMAASFLVKEMEPYMVRLPSFEWITKKIPANNICYIGLRSVDPPEAKILQELGILAYTMDDIDSMGIHQITNMALQHISECGRRPIHVSFDIDSLCETYVKSTGTPVPGGLNIREAITVCHMAFRTNRLVSLDMVEVNPLIGSFENVDITARYAKHLILSAFGHLRGGLPSETIPKP